jgi:Bacterial capsule synthesis protein PGA_cap
VVLALLAGSIAGGSLFAVLQTRGNTTATTVAPTLLPPVTAVIAAPTTTLLATTTSAPRPIVIHGVGDTNFDPNYIPAFTAEGYELAFSGLAGLFATDDLTVVNLECSPSDLGEPFDKKFIFRCDPAALPVAAAAGVEVANLANNHGQDYGTEAMLDGRQNLIAAGIAPVGVGANLKEALAPALFEIGDRTVAVLGFGGVHPSSSWLATETDPGMADGDDIELMETAVAAAAARADIVVVTIHWGVELVTDPSAADREAAVRMIAAGADAIFGHHPHRLGGMELIEGKPVFWTLGNFVWPRMSDAGATTAIARVVFSPDDTVIACLVPAFIESGGRPVLRGEPRCEGEP